VLLYIFKRIQLIDNNILITICVCFCLVIGAIALLFYAVNKIQDKRVEAFGQGAELVMESLRRDGRLAPAGQANTEDIKPEHIDSFYQDEPEDDEQETGIPDILLARSQKAAEQMGKDELNKVMGAMNAKV